MEQLKNPMMEAHKKGPVQEHHDDDLVHSFSSSSSSSSSGISSGSSMDSDPFEEVTSSNFSPSSSDHLAAHDPLSNMSSLFQQLPIKMGLSRHYEGKSRSFTSLANVRSLEDLGKEENPEKKKKKKMKMMKCCRRSYGGGLCRNNAMSRQISKREWHSRRDSANVMGRTGRPPIPAHRSTTTTISNQTALFA